MFKGFFNADNITEFQWKRQAVFVFVLFLLLYAWKFGIESLLD